MIAIPINTLGAEPILSNYFGQSKWFAIFDEGTITFEKNKFDNGCKIVDWLYDLGVTQTVISHIGLNPLLKLYDMDIECLYVDCKKCDKLEGVLDQIHNSKLKQITLNNKDIAVDLDLGCKEVC